MKTTIKRHINYNDVSYGYYTNQKAVQTGTLHVIASHITTNERKTDNWQIKLRNSFRFYSLQSDKKDKGKMNI